MMTEEQNISTSPEDADGDIPMDDKSPEKAEASPVSDSDTHASNADDEEEEEETHAAASEENGSAEIKDEDATTKKEETEEEARKRREKYKDWPLKNISEPHDNDVLYGRGGGTNHHPGNKRYRKMVEDRKVDYVNSKRLDKPLVALEIIREWRGQEPPGRFLKFDEKTKKWNDVGDKKAREKTSQALREKAPLIRKKQEEERLAHERGDEGEEERTKSTRFADGTNLNDGAKEGGISKAVLARDHSLGREYLEPDEAIALDGFSWQDPFRSGAPTNSPGAVGGRSTTSQSSFSGPPPPEGFHPSARMGSQGSSTGAHYRYPSQGSIGPPVPPSEHGTYTHYRSGEERHFRYTASGRYESWCSNGSMPPPMSGFGYPHTSGSSWGERDHSLGQNPLPHASVGHPARYPTFDPHSRAPSGQWGPPPPPSGYPPMSGPPPYSYSGGPPQPHPYPPPRVYSGGPPNMPSPTRGMSPSSSSGAPQATTSPRYEVSPKVASTWSGQSPGEIAKSWSESSGENGDRFRRAAAPPVPSANTSIPKPDFVKRNTSHQNETPETRPSVKRAALNRDNSLASNRLKEQYMPDYYQMKKFNDELLKLSDDFEQSTLSETDGPPIKPKPLSQEERISTIDQIAMDLMVRPEPLSGSTRSSTIDALALELDDDPIIRPEALSRGSSLSGFLSDRPPVLGPNDRLTTNDVLELVSEPIPDDEAELVSGQRTAL